MLRRQFLFTALAALPDTVETTAGRVRGARANGVTVFRGIPYASQRRFQAPGPATPWTGVRDCTQTGARCVQGPGNIFLSPTIGEYFRGSAGRAELAAQPDSEDCLVVNVLTPSTRGKRPVMVYIHGGGFSAGSSHLTLFADRFPAEQDVVLVGVNHRINVFGYLHLETANIGQLDLIAALEWVRANIGAFGGDAGNVTVFGESGGAAKISALLGMPAARGLFRRAIVESGSLLAVQTADEAAANTREVLAKVPLAQLKSLPAAELWKATNGMKTQPAVDGKSIPSQLWEAAPVIDVPLIIGCCKDETALFTLKEEALYSLDEKGLAERMPAAAVAAYHAAYPKASPSDIWFRYATDKDARAKALRQAELQIQKGKSPVYMYHFEWNTPLVDGKIRAFHTAELPLAMRCVRFPESEPVSKALAHTWAQFARRGKPDWPAYTLNKRMTMIFDAPVSAPIPLRLPLEPGYRGNL